MTLLFFRQLADALNQGAIVLATVIQCQGSVPREVGAKLFVTGNGEIVGTIGGGAGEAKVIQQAAIVLATGDSQLVEIDLTGAAQRQTQGVCGGKMQVWLARWHGDTAVALVNQIILRLEQGQAVTLVTSLQSGRLPYLQTAPDQAVSGAIDLIFTDTIQPTPTLLIIGAGHCGIQLAKVADLIGFQVMVQDDRPQWATPANYPQASRIFTTSIATVIAQFNSQTQLYIALVTRGYQHDVEALQSLLQSGLSCQYIGMIGSQKRVRQVFQAVEQAGIPPAKLSQVHAPIGLDIGALTPEEIAVSIAAELILTRRGGTGHPLSQKNINSGMRTSN